MSFVYEKKCLQIFLGKIQRQSKMFSRNFISNVLVFNGFQWPLNFRNNFHRLWKNVFIIATIFIFNYVSFAFLELLINKDFVFIFFSFASTLKNSSLLSLYSSNQIKNFMSLN
jgi:hypothetical protein